MYYPVMCPKTGGMADLDQTTPKGLCKFCQGTSVMIQSNLSLVVTHGSVENWLFQESDLFNTSLFHCTLVQG